MQRGNRPNPSRGGSAGRRAAPDGVGAPATPTGRRLLVVAHPALPLSHFDEHLIAVINAGPSVTTRNLYAAHQHTTLDATAEREAVADADAVVLLTLLRGRALPRLATAWLEAVSGGNPIEQNTQQPPRQTFRLLATGGVEAAPAPLSPLQHLQTESTVHHVRHLVQRADLLWQEPILLRGSEMPADGPDRATRRILAPLWRPQDPDTEDDAETDETPVRVS